MCAGHVSTSVLGPIVSVRDAADFLPLRERRYERALELMEAYLRTGTSVVIDGTFSLRRWRKVVYRVAAKLGVREVAAVSCVCSDPAQLEQRFRFRDRNPSSPDASASTMIAYEGSVSEFEGLDREALPSSLHLSRVVFDSCLEKVESEGAGPVGQQVARAIQAFIEGGRLSAPMFAGRQSGYFVVALEGLGGSGKTTQADLLKARLLGSAQTVDVRGEFSTTALGDFLRNGLKDGLKVHMPEGDGLCESLVVLMDFLGSLIHRPQPDGITIFDSGPLARMAHLEALRPLWIPHEALLEVLRAALGLLDSNFKAPGVSIYLDCPSNIALDRLARRLSGVSRNDSEFVQALHQAYCNLLKERTDVFRVDATRPAVEVADRIHEIVRSQLAIR